MVSVKNQFSSDSKKAGEPTNDPADIQASGRAQGRLRARRRIDGRRPPATCWRGKAGGPVESPSLITSTAKFDPVRPETVRLISQAAKKIGFGIEPNPIDYNQGIQKVIMQHDYDMFLVRLTGASVRDRSQCVHPPASTIRPTTRRGGYNWTGYKKLQDRRPGRGATESRWTSPSAAISCFEAQEADRTPTNPTTSSSIP